MVAETRDRLALRRIHGQIGSNRRGRNRDTGGAERLDVQARGLGETERVAQIPHYVDGELGIAAKRDPIRSGR